MKALFFLSKVRPLRRVCCLAPLCLLQQLCRGKAAWNQQPQGCRCPLNPRPPHHCVYLKTATVPSETLRWKLLTEYLGATIPFYVSLGKSLNIVCLSYFIFPFTLPSGDSRFGGSLPAALQAQPIALHRACWEHSAGAKEEGWNWRRCHQPPALGTGMTTCCDLANLFHLH